MKGSEKGANSDSKEDNITDPKTPDWTSPSLFSILAAGSSGSLTGITRSGDWLGEPQQRRSKGKGKIGAAVFVLVFIFCFRCLQ